MERPKGITIVNKITGEVYFFINDPRYELGKEEIAIEEIQTEFFVKAFFDFERKTFYEGATEEEIKKYQKSLVPLEVPRWKIIRQLKTINLFESVVNSIKKLPEPTQGDTMAVLEMGTSFERDNSVIDFIQNDLELRSEQVDEIFVNANKIEINYTPKI